MSTAPDPAPSVRRGLDPHPTPAQVLAKKAEQDRRSGVASQAATRFNGVTLGPASPMATPPRRSRREMGDQEFEEQCAFFGWAEEQEPAHPELWLLYAIPNWFGVGTKRQGARAKAEGRKKGMLDVHLPVARGGHHSLYIEFKAEGGTPSSEQKTRIARLREAGNRVEVCMSAEAAKAITLHYLSSPWPRPRG